MNDLYKILKIPSNIIKAKTSSEELNNILDGGFYSNKIYHIYGFTNSGKSSIALDAAINSESKDDFILYINAERKPINSINKENVIFIYENNIANIVKYFNDMPKINVSLIVYDTVAVLYSDVAYKTKKYRSNTLQLLLERTIKYLHKFNNPAIILLNQVREDVFNKIKRITYTSKTLIDKVSNISIFCIDYYKYNEYRYINLKIERGDIKYKKNPIVLLITNTGRISKGFDVFKKIRYNPTYINNGINYEGQKFSTPYEFIKWYDLNK